MHVAASGLFILALLGWSFHIMSELEWGHSESQYWPAVLGIGPPHLSDHWIEKRSPLPLGCTGQEFGLCNSGLEGMRNAVDLPLPRSYCLPFLGAERRGRHLFLVTTIWRRVSLTGNCWVEGVGWGLSGTDSYCGYQDVVDFLNNCFLISCTP